ncbi:unnamed protein product, partial [Mesorhabditis belari]|uniref:Carboxylic ester hydrolase n=1 Tax=Mesorhabditis belari TaxID=2138241 RepID=A0AAF3FNM5_9BILA
MISILLLFQGLFTPIVYANELVETPYGDLKGFSYTTANGNQGRVFLGIKYGFGPRFKKPYPITYYGNVDATKFGPICPQIDGRDKAARLGTTVSDDCLSLNIYAQQDSPSLNPVLVWIHGDHLQTGHANLDPEVVIERFVSRGVLFVSLQYRLGALGFFNIRQFFNATSEWESEIDSNVGAYDVLLAMNWIQKNIESFGGDPRQVTVAGHSSGACLASALHLSGKAQGLFHRLILQSGTSETCFDGVNGYRDMPAKMAQQFCSIDLHSADLDSNLIHELEICMLKQEIDQFIEFDKKNFLGWSLVVDGELFEGIPAEMSERLDDEKIEILLGITRDEWAFYEMKLMQSGMKVLDPSVYNWRSVVKFVLKTLAFAFPRSVMNEKMRKIADGYTLSSINKHVAAWLETTNDVLTDAFFASKLVREIEIYRNHTKNAFLYELTQPASSFSIDGYKPAMHGDDVTLLFGRKESKAAKEMTRLWTDFVKGFSSIAPLNRSEWNYAEIDDLGVTERRDFRRNGKTI